MVCVSEPGSGCICRVTLSGRVAMQAGTRAVFLINSDDMLELPLNGLTGVAVGPDGAFYDTDMATAVPASSISADTATMGFHHFPGSVNGRRWEVCEVFAGYL